MNGTPTPAQTLLLWRILAAGGHDGSVMQKLLGVSVDPKDRRALASQGLLTEAKVKGGAIKLTVTDAGWEWANEHLDADLPSRATSAMTKLLQEWLRLMKAHLRRTGHSIADLFPDSTSSQSFEPKQSLRSQVRAAYLSLTNNRLKTRCLLRDLRSRLPHISRQELDAEIESMVADGIASLLRLDNRLEITAADEEASIFLGGERQHLLWIDR